jgi:hypothetical protein
MRSPRSTEPAFQPFQRPTTIEWAQTRSVEVRFGVFLRLTVGATDEHAVSVWDQLFHGTQPRFTADTLKEETVEALLRAYTQ